MFMISVAIALPEVIWCCIAVARKMHEKSFVKFLNVKYILLNIYVCKIQRLPNVCA